MSTQLAEPALDAGLDDSNPDLRIIEAVDLLEDATQSDGTVLMHVIRPGLGRGKGKHYYPAEMLRENATVFAGWRMYVDHESDQARRAAGGLPRSIRDLGGRIIESWWDESVPADDSHERGAVVARVKPVGFVRDLIEEDHELVKSSINANATSVRSHNHEGVRCWLVEGIRPKGSVDWVTEAGAGGKIVAALQEALSETADQQALLLDSMADDDLRSYVEARALEAEGEGDGEGDGDGEGNGDVEPALVTDKGEGGEVEITSEQVQEALSTPEAASIIAETAAAQVAPLLERVEELVEARIEEERDLVRAETRGEFQREIELRDMQDDAHSRIKAAGLPPAFEEQSLTKFALTESGPSEDLDVIDEIDSEGTVTRKAREVLMAAVDNEISEQRSLVATVRPTRVLGQGSTKLAEGVREDGGDKPTKRAKPTTGSQATDEMLLRAGFAREQLTEMWAGK